MRVLSDSVGLASAAQACWEGTYIRGGRASLFLSQRAVRIDVTTVPAPRDKSDSPVADSSQDFQRRADAEAFRHRHILLLSECHPPQSARSKAGGDKDYGLSTDRRQVQVKGAQVLAYRDESSPHPQPDLPLNSGHSAADPPTGFAESHLVYARTLSGPWETSTSSKLFSRLCF